MFGAKLSSVSRLVLAGGFALGVLGATLPVPAMAAASEVLKEAQDYLKDGDFNAAIIQLKSAVRDDPTNAALRLALGRIYISTGQGLPAEKEVRAAMKNGADAAETQLPLAQSLLMLRRFNDVLAETNPAQASSTSRPVLLAVHAQAHNNLGNFLEAEDLAREAYQAKPEEALLTTVLTTALMGQERYSDAEAVIDEFIATQKPSVQVYHMKGEIRRSQDDPESAIAAYDKVLELDDQHVPALISRALIRLNTGDIEAGKEDIDLALTIAPNHLMGKYLRALSLFREQSFREAEDYLVSVGEALREYSPALYLMASVKYSLGELEQAQRFVEEYLSTSPENPSGLGLLGGILLRNNKPLRAIEVLERADRGAPENFGILMLLGNAYMAAQQYEKASEAFEKGRQLNPDNVLLKTQAALSQLGLGKKDEAVSNLEDLIQQGDNPQQAGFALILTHLRDGRPDDALKVVEQLEQTLTDTPLPKYFRADIMRVKGEHQESLSLMKGILADTPDFMPARLGLAGLHIEMGNLKDASDVLDTVLADNPKSATALIASAKVAELRNAPDSAEDYLHRAIDGDPKRAQFRNELVQFLVRSGRLKDALREAKDFANSFPDLPLAHDAHVRAALAAQRPDDALLAIVNLTRLRPDVPEVQFQYARVLSANNDNEGAKRALRRALELQPDYQAAGTALIQLVVDTEGVEAGLAETEKFFGNKLEGPARDLRQASYLLRVKKVDEAKAIYVKLLEGEEPPQEAVINFYRAMYQEGKGAEARDWLTKWIEGRPDDHLARIMLADSLLTAGELEAAARQYEVLVERVPENPTPWNNLAWIYSQTGSDKALETAEEAYRLSNGSPLVADTYAWLLFKAGKVEESLRLLKVAYVKTGNNMEIAYHYAAALEAAGQKDEALKIAQRVVESPARFPELDEAKQLFERLK